MEYVNHFNFSRTSLIFLYVCMYGRLVTGLAVPRTTRSSQLQDQSMQVPLHAIPNLYVIATLGTGRAVRQHSNPYIYCVVCMYVCMCVYVIVLVFYCRLLGSVRLICSLFVFFVFLVYFVRWQESLPLPCRWVAVARLLKILYSIYVCLHMCICMYGRWQGL